MKLADYKLIFIAVGLVGVLLFASPALASIIRPPAGEQFSELYLLGPNRMAEGYPYNIAVGQNYSVYAGVVNHMGSSTYYVLNIKFKNQTDLLPNATAGLPSPVEPLYEYRFVLEDGAVWEQPLTFTIQNATILGNISQIDTLQVNGISFNVGKPAAWDSNSTTFNYQLLCELWAYNHQSNTLAYHNRFVNLHLNLTATS